ncbi:MAG: PIG-L deacetylase family protein [bacterium]|nr:PIG-L deacetylase family protein [bacterium]
MNILAIGAHPDDIEYGCGGTLLKYRDRGDKIYLLVLTFGELGGDSNIRKIEQEKAAKVLRTKKLFWGQFKDTKIPTGRALISKLDSVIKEVEPDEVYVNYYKDDHQDHRACSECVIAAARYVKRVLFYEDYTSQNFEPNIFVNIEDILEEKIKLLGIHKSQVKRSYPTGLDMLEAVRSIASYRGFQGKIKYAEGFISFRYAIEI